MHFSQKVWSWLCSQMISLWMPSSWKKCLQTELAIWRNWCMFLLLTLLKSFCKHWMNKEAGCHGCWRKSSWCWRSESIRILSRRELMCWQCAAGVRSHAVTRFFSGTSFAAHTAFRWSEESRMRDNFKSLPVSLWDKLHILGWRCQPHSLGGK